MTDQLPLVNQIWYHKIFGNETHQVMIRAVIDGLVVYKWQGGESSSEPLDYFLETFAPLTFEPDETYPEVRYTRVFKGGTFNGLFACVPDKDNTDAIGVVALKPDWSSYVEYVDPS